MIDPESDDATKLAEARRLFDDTVGVYEKFYSESEEDVRFESGDQWSPEDKKALEEERRPALTFNLIQSVVDHNVGALEDAKKAPRAVAVSRNDRFLADILNDFLDRVRNEISLSMDEMEAASLSSITGLGGVAIDANEDPERDDYILISTTPLSCTEFKFDPHASKADLSDAEFLIRDRWMTESEFKRTYPNQADLWEELLAQPTDQTSLDSSDTASQPHRLDPTDFSSRADEWGINRARREVRVVHLEYKVARKVRRATSKTSPSQFMELTDAEAEEAAKDDSFRLGYDLDQKHRTKIEIRWLEFAGARTILFDDESPLPIKGFSVVPFPWRRNRHDHTFQGKVRSLKDPQREVNKRFSQEIHLINSMAQPGTDIEVGATPMSTAEFERAGKTPGGVREITAGRMDGIRDRPMPQMPDAVARLHDQAVQILRIVSNTTMDTLLEPRGIPEAAATAQLRHRQSTLAMVPVIRNYQSFQRTIARRILEIIVNSFSDTQLEDMLSNSDKFTVRDGHVQELDGEQREAQLRDVRSLRYNVELVTTAESENSSQLTQLSFLDTAKEREIPVAPDVYLDLLPLPRDTKDRLKEFALEQSQATLQLKQAEIAQAQQNILIATEADRQKRQVEMVRLQEERRHNFAAEITQAVKVGFEHQGRMAEVIAKAGAEELSLISQVIDLVGRQQEAKQLAAVQSGSNQGAGA